MYFTDEKLYLRAIGETSKNANKTPRLAYEIVLYAVKDWRQLVKRKAWKKTASPKCNFNELRKFFKSDWCAFLMQGVRVPPQKILQMLEEELKEAKRKEKNDGPSEDG